MGCTGLQSLPVVHHTLDGVGCLCTVELFLVGLLTTGNRHCQYIFAEISVDIEHTLCLFLGLLGSCVHGMTFLPQEFTVAQERTAGLFPTQNAAPLIEHHRQIPVGLNGIFEILTEKGLGGRTNAVALLQLFAAAIGNPSALGSKAFHMILFLLQKALRNQHGHIHILGAGLLKLRVHNPLDVFPNRIAVRPVDKHTLNGGIVDQLCLFAHIGKPLGKVYLHIGDLFHFLIFCHNFHPLEKQLNLFRIVSHLSSIS